MSFDPFLLLLVGGRLLGDFYWANELALLARLLVAGLGTYLFCRGIRLSKTAATLGGLCYMLAPQMPLRLEQVDMLGGIWIPAGLAQQNTC